ncbi:MAG: SIMPL domain-containing protein [Saprospiraceae bacterium]|nr:SIMPL domain-containing protein [Saprospiraceae bacterium]
MKTAIKMMIVLFMSALVSPMIAQNAKTISVFGSAEKTVEPDEIFVSLTLQEYSDDSGTKMTISQLESSMLKAAKEIGIPNANIMVENVTGYGNYGGYEGAENSFLISKMYQVRVANLDALNKLVEKLGMQGLASANVTYFNNSKMKQMMNDLKGAALQNAKDEAEILLKSTGKKLGDLMNIEVVQDYGAAYTYDGYAPFYGALPANASGKMTAKPITLRYSVKVVYAIQ